MIPIRIDKRLNRRPVVNWLVVLVNVLIFVFVQKMGHNDAAMQEYYLHPDQPELYQFFTSVFLHHDWMHLIGNMVFLWVFGNAVNDAFGHVGYLAFYLGGGVTAGIGYVLLSGSEPVLGASGAISAVTGAFLVLFPRVRVTVLTFLFYVMMPFEISSLVFLLLQFIWNLYASLNAAGGGIAYAAHSSGYVYGIVVVAGLLGLRLLPRDVYDLLSLLRTWRRRAAYRGAVAGGFDPFGRKSVAMDPSQSSRWIHNSTPGGEPPAAPSAREVQLRQQIAADHARGDLAAAVQGYLTLVQVSEEPLLPLAQQLDLANYLMSTEQYPAAADAYERFLRHYSHYQYSGDIRLMLGLIYSRYLNQDSLAEKYLSGAIPGLMDDSKLELARSELAKVRQRLG